MNNPKFKWVTLAIWIVNEITLNASEIIRKCGAFMVMFAGD
jgi:hypothetical protein